MSRAGPARPVLAARPIGLRPTSPSPSPNGMRSGERSATSYSPVSLRTGGRSKSPIDLTNNPMKTDQHHRRTSVGIHFFDKYVEKEGDSDLSESLVGDYHLHRPSESIFAIFFAVVSIKNDISAAFAVETKRELGDVDKNVNGKKSQYFSSIFTLFMVCALVIIAQGSMTWYIFMNCPH